MIIQHTFKNSFKKERWICLGQTAAKGEVTWIRGCFKGLRLWRFWSINSAWSRIYKRVSTYPGSKAPKIWSCPCWRVHTGSDAWCMLKISDRNPHQLGLFSQITNKTQRISLFVRAAFLMRIFYCSNTRRPSDKISFINSLCFFSLEITGGWRAGGANYRGSKTRPESRRDKASRASS